MDVDEGENTAKAILRPRRAGENIKVAETVLKRRDRNLKAAGQRAAAVAKVRKDQREYKKGKLKIIRAEKLIKNCLIRIQDRKRQKTSKKKRPNPKLVHAARSLAVIRNGRMGGSKEVKVALRQMGLGLRNTLVFAPNDADTARNLELVKPFAFWGKCSFKVVFNLVHKKAMFKDPEAPKEKVMLCDNVLIEKHLGDLGVLCTEDLAHALHTNGKTFTAVRERLWPIPLGDAKKSNGMVHDKKFTFGDLQSAMDLKVAKLIGE
mmetsp:Transcript_16618/g.42941  ORF Transcript_16618/g.42941 Transcript_16618/m.42941 type:complete len:263 (-) Transcript_16618:131-919(-)